MRITAGEFPIHFDTIIENQYIGVLIRMHISGHNDQEVMVNHPIRPQAVIVNPRYSSEALLRRLESFLIFPQTRASVPTAHIFKLQ